MVAGLNTGASTNFCNDMEGYPAMTLRPVRGSTIQQRIYQKEYLQADLGSKT